jgi:hypothetical protein
MHPLFIRFFIVLAIAMAAMSAMKSNAAPLSESQAQQIQLVIATQLKAFADDDADRAFDIATPAVRKAIGSSDRFLAMVRGAYPMVYRPASVTFLKPETDEGTVLQLVQITDSDDKSWLALFALEQQPDASWRISGCAVAENHWRAA